MQGFTGHEVATTVTNGVVTYHNTVVVDASDRSAVRLNTGGWHTVTTKRRMNQASQAMGLGFQVWQSNYEWFVYCKDGVLDYEDNMVIDCS